MNPHPDRRANPLTDEQIEALANALADKVAEKAYERFVAYVGKSVVKHIVWLLVLGGIAVASVWRLRGSGPPP